MDEFDKDLVLTSGIQAELPGNLFFGNLPPRLELYVLSGSSNDFSSLQFLEGSFIDKGTLLLGGSGPGGIFQVINLSSNTVSGTVQSPPLLEDDITDFSG